MEGLEGRVNLCEVLSVLISSLTSLKRKDLETRFKSIIASTVPSGGLSVVWGEGAEELENKVGKTSKYCAN